MSTNTLTLRDTITPRTEKWIRISAVMAMVIVAASSAILSFDGLQKLALASRVPEHLAFLFPIAVDTTILMGSLAVLLYELVGVRSVFGWFTVLFGTVLSVTGNVISVNDAGLIAQVLHGIIPILLCISLESLLRILRFNIQRSNKALEMEHKGTQNVDFEQPVTPVEIVKEPETVVPSAEKEPEQSTPVTETSEARLVTESVNVPKSASVPEPVSVPLPEPSPVEETPVFESVPTEEPVVEVVHETTEEPAEVPEKPVEAPEPVAEPETAEEPEETPAKPAPKRTATRKAPAKKAPAKRAPARKTVNKEEEGADPVPVPENVEKYKEFLATLPAGKTRRDKALEVKRKFPGATVTDIKAAILG